jgi:hypothetical protein
LYGQGFLSASRGPQLKKFPGSFFNVVHRGTLPLASPGNLDGFFKVGTYYYNWSTIGLLHKGKEAGVMIEAHMGEGKGVTAGHRGTPGGGGGTDGAQVIPKLQLGNAAPATVAVTVAVYLSFSFLFIFSGSPPRYCTHNMCVTLAHIISNTSSIPPVFFFFYFRASNVRAGLSAYTFAGLQETGMCQSTIFDTLLPLGFCFVPGCVW